MLDRTYPTQVCSVARSLEVVGERWSLLIVRDAFLGRTRFSEFLRSLGIARNVLTQRLEHLVAEDILDHREDGAYVLTTKGRGLAPVLHQLMKWGDRHYAPDGPPILTLHVGCGGRVDASMLCDRCGERVARQRDVELVPGPGRVGRGSAERPSTAAG